MGTPQILVIVLYALSAWTNLCKHGETRTEKINFWTALLAIAIKTTVLIWGGFFK